MQSLVEKADSFASIVHDGQLRKDDVTPFITHPRKVRELYEKFFEKDNEENISVCLLHDVVEDTKTTEGQIRDIFGNRVASMVFLLTREKGITKDVYYARLSTVILDVKCIKMCDRLANLYDTLDLVQKNQSDKNIDFARFYIFDTFKMLNAIKFNKGFSVTKEIMNTVAEIAKWVY